MCLLTYLLSYLLTYPPANFGGTTTIHFLLMGHWANTAQTDHETLRPWPLILKVTAPVADAGRRPLHSYTKFEVYRPCHSEDMAHDVCQH